MESGGERPNCCSRRATKWKTDRQRSRCSCPSIGTRTKQSTPRGGSDGRLCYVRLNGCDCGAYPQDRGKGHKPSRAHAPAPRSTMRRESRMGHANPSCRRDLPEVHRGTEEVMDDNIRSKLAEISAQWRSAGKIGPAISKSVSQAYELGRAEGTKEGMRRAAVPAPGRHPRRGRGDLRPHDRGRPPPAGRREARDGRRDRPAGPRGMAPEDRQPRDASMARAAHLAGHGPGIHESTRTRPRARRTRRILTRRLKSSPSTASGGSAGRRRRAAGARRLRFTRTRAACRRACAPRA